MTPEESGWGENRLPEVFHQYKEAWGSPEAGVNFMPELWARIEAKRSRTRVFERAARSLVGFAVALSLVLGAFLSLQGRQPSAFYSESFVEEIASDNVSAQGTFFEPVQLQLTATERRHR